MKTKYKVILLLITFPIWFLPVVAWFYIVDLYEHLRR